ncbi:hypothetical protein [Hyphomonas sp.]|uniref:hypothetical protein n=1 Tax=Hyphomonas sp. TaxID=87 RepID=UPI001D6555A8|nr:hypothetical protein [Hyphomonas sp.]MBU3920479.1 hypothetical protein [Alphaproteobacteria bacterium]MBU4060698.1 hypothetical protein [Alphaproteobacteria bacterium]MBU4164682.1 hypothetical protein [Alphaproteobacteria bacterium]
MKIDFNITPAGEIATKTVLSPAQVTALAAAAGAPAVPARLDLLARRNIRWARRDVR